MKMYTGPTRHGMGLVPVRECVARAVAVHAICVMQGLIRFNELFVGYPDLDERILVHLGPEDWPDWLCYTYFRFEDAWRWYWHRLRRETLRPPEPTLPTLFEHLITGLPKMGYPLCLEGLRC